MDLKYDNSHLIDGNLLASVAKQFPEFTVDQLWQSAHNIPSHLLDRQFYLNGLNREVMGKKREGVSELEVEKRLKNYFPHKRENKLTEEQKEKNKAYYQKVTQTPTTPPKNAPNQPKLLLMDEAKAKREVWELIKAELGFRGKQVKILKQLPRTDKERKDLEGVCYFVMDGHTKTIIQNLTLYFIQSPSSPLNLNKGIYLCGGCGVGKTMLFRVFSKFTTKHKLPNQFGTLKVATLIREVFDSKIKDKIRQATQTPKLIDDIGEEAGLCGWFDGQNKGVNLVKRILDTRYEKYKASNLTTHISSNLIPGSNQLGESEVVNLYGRRLVSRFREMFNVVFWDGGDKRR